MCAVAAHGPLKSIALCLILCGWGCLAPLSAAAQDQNATRRDNVLGTVHEGIVMERDPETGSNVIIVGPRPKEKEEPQAQPPVLLIQPEVKIKAP